VRKSIKSISVVLSLSMVVASSASFAQNCACGPDFCKGDPRYPNKLSAKKNALKTAGYPADLVALMDRDGACVARIEQAPDGFSLMTVDPRGGKIVIGWADDQESVARDQLIGGQLKAYYKFNVRKRFACCGDPKPEDAPDWDSSLELSTGLAIKCTKSSGTAVCN
jgi:hypothetical protein